MFAMRRVEPLRHRIGEYLAFQGPGGRAAHGREHRFEGQIQLGERLSASARVGSLPLAYSMSTRASGPTSMAWPFQRGDLSQE